MFRNLDVNKNIYNECAKSGKFVIAAVSTTSFGKNPDIIELSALKCKYKGGKFLPYDAIHIYMDSDKKISDACLKIHGITKDEIKGMPRAEDWRDYVADFFYGSDIMATYSVNCNDIIHAEFPENIPERYVNIKSMAADMLWTTPLDSHRLKTVGLLYGIDTGGELRAVKCTRILYRLFNGMLYEITQAKGREERLYSPRVESVGVRQMFRGQKRIYVNMNIGTIYYDVLGDVWKPKDDMVDIKEISVQSVSRQAAGMIDDVKYPGIKGLILHGPGKNIKKQEAYL